MTRLYALLACMALAVAASLDGDVSCFIPVSSGTMNGTVNVSAILPTVFLTDVQYPLGIKLQWYIGLSPCLLSNATLPENKRCAPGYGYAVSPLSFLHECSEVFPEAIERRWVYEANAVRLVVRNPADGRIVNTTIACNMNATANITLTAPIHTPDAHHYYITAESSGACPE
jgi:hypothetical protein